MHKGNKNVKFYAKCKLKIWENIKIYLKYKLATWKRIMMCLSNMNKELKYYGY
jgi:hypothetical protein